MIAKFDTATTAFFCALLCAVALIASPWGMFHHTDKSCPQKCNVILILMDTLSAGHIGTYGYDRDTMPRTTAFFEQHNGIQFDDVTSAAPWTLPSFISLYYSDIAPRITYHTLEHSTERPSLPSVLRSNSVHIGGSVQKLNVFIVDGITRLFQRGELSLNGNPLGFASSSLARTASSSEPFFFLVHSFAAHDPYQPKNGYEKLFEETDEFPVVTMDDLVSENRRTSPNPTRDDVFRLRYDQGIAQADAQLADFLRSIPTTTLANTVVILSSDHGEAFGQHDRVWHANSLYQEELHVPLLMIVPGLAAQRIEDPVSTLDISPTILSLMQIDVPSSFIGSDLSPLLAGGTLGIRTIPFANGFPEYLKPDSLKPGFKAPNTLEDAGMLDEYQPIIIPTQYGVRRGDEKLTATLAHGRLELKHFNLKTDPGETTSLLKSPADVPPTELMSALLELMH